MKTIYEYIIEKLVTEKLKLKNVRLDNKNDIYYGLKFILINELANCTVKELQEIGSNGLDHKGIIEAIFTHENYIEYLEKKYKELLTILEKYLNNKLDYFTKNEIHSFMDNVVKTYIDIK